MTTYFEDIDRVIEVRASRSRLGTGVVTCEVETLNQDGEVVQKGIDVLLIGSRGTSDAGVDT